MKNSVGSDPFEDEPPGSDASEDAEGVDEEEPEEEPEPQETTGESKTDSDTDNAVTDDESGNADDTSGGVEPPSEVPYVIDRDGVNEGRKMINLQVRPEFSAKESELRREVASAIDLDPDEVYAYDLREAMYRVALEHSDEVAEKLIEDGYNWF